MPLVSGDDLASGTDDLGDIFGEVGKDLHTKMKKKKIIWGLVHIKEVDIVNANI